MFIRRFVAVFVIGMLICVTPVQAETRVHFATKAAETAELDFSSIPAHGQLQVGDRVFSVERVSNGFVAREEGGGESVVITDDDLRAYSAEVVATDPSTSFLITRSELLGPNRSLRVDVDHADHGSFSGTMVAPGLTTQVRYDSAAPSLSEPDYQGGVATEEVILVITISAAVIGTISCAILSLLMDCAQDCADACSQCGGSLLSSEEGWCGTCDCECQVPGIHYEIPPGGSCSAY